MNDRDINHLHPDLQPLCRAFLAKCLAAGLDARITFTYRTPQEQDALYAIGRTKPGKRVTNLKGKASKHCFTLNGTPAARAFDYALFRAGKPIKDGDDPEYMKAGLIGEALGLGWGGRWKKPHDAGHFELKG